MLNKSEQHEDELNVNNNIFIKITFRNIEDNMISNVMKANLIIKRLFLMKV